MSARLDEEERRLIEKLARQEKKGKGEVMRELIKYGYYYLMLQKYRKGEISLEKLSQELSLTISETLDILEGLGITSPVEYEDYLKGSEFIKKIF